MGHSFRRALHVTTDWLMRYSPNRWYFPLAHACFVVLVSIAGHNIAMKISPPASMHDQAALLPFYAAMLPLILVLIPMHDKKNEEHRAITCVISIGLALVVACVGFFVGAFLSMQPFY